MGRVASVGIAVCETYDGLAAECEAARQAWNKRRAEIAAQGLRGKEIDDELRRLQAKYARSNAMLRDHLRDCELCQFA